MIDKCCSRQLIGMLLCFFYYTKITEYIYPNIGITWLPFFHILDPRLTQSFQTQLIETLEHSDWPIIVFGTCDKLSLVSDGIRETALHEVVVPVCFGFPSYTSGIFERYTKVELWVFIGTFTNCSFSVIYKFNSGRSVLYFCLRIWPNVFPWLKVLNLGSCIACWIL